MYERIERPCGECLWHGADGCTTWDCKPVTLEEARKIVRDVRPVARGKMYDELVERLRAGEYTLEELSIILPKAAAAIEDLSWATWRMFERRPMNEEERRYYSEHYGYNLTDDEAVIYCCELPKDGQEVLVCSKYGHIWLDTLVDDPDYGVGLEMNGDMDGVVAWMPLPEPPKEG